MKGRSFSTLTRLGFALILVGCLVFLLLAHLPARIDTNLTSLLPGGASPQTALARKLTSEKQGKLVYLALDRNTADQQEYGRARALLTAALDDSDLVARWSPSQQLLDADSLKTLSQQRVELFLPKWWAAKQAEHARLSSDEPFPVWAAEAAVAEFDEFLSSPEAIELGQSELVDPLLLGIGAMRTLAASEAGPSPEANPAATLIWLEVARSALEVENQDLIDGFFKETSRQISEIDQSLSLNYGGLTRLAKASRERIQKDVFKINALSLFGVALVSILFLRKPWTLLWVAPAAIAAIIGATAVTIAAMGSIHVIVLVIGSILIGTSVDYGFHMIFRAREVAAFPTRKLLFFACLSTVAGFAILAFSDFILIRQIGVFTGSGLIFAFLAAQLLPQVQSVVPEKAPSAPKSSPILMLSTVALLALGMGGFLWANWDENVRGLEAPDPAIVAEDLALRDRIENGADRTAFVVMADSYLDTMAKEDVVLKMLTPEERDHIFALSKSMPTRSDVRSLLDQRPLIATFANALKAELEASSFESSAFENFFNRLSELAIGARAAIFEAALDRLQSNLSGPLAITLGDSDGFYWSVILSSELSDTSSAQIHSLKGVYTLSGFSFLNDLLTEIRASLARSGLVAFGVVAILIMLSFGIRSGWMILALPLAAVFAALGIAFWIQGSLGLFHLIGAFLAMALTLDYGLFGIAAFTRGLSLPFSVKLSAATTLVSFTALCASAIPAVQALGLTVSLSILIAALSLASLRGRLPITAARSSDE